jgi:Na+/H+-translocating membrane pyrophosphatase
VTGFPRLSKELLSGFIFLAIGAATEIFCSERHVGSLSQMGPFFFPAMLGGLLVALGALICISSLVRSSQVTRMQFDSIGSSLLIPFAAACFGLLVERVGLVVAVLATVIVACYAGRETRLWEAVANMIVLAAATSIIFVYLLNMPWAIWPPGWSWQ